MTTHDTAQMTVTELLRQQHQQVKAMFTELLGATGASRQELFDCLRATLAVHETSEEMVVYPMVRKTGDGADQVVDARVKEEDEAKQVLARLEKMDAGGAEFAQELAGFHAAVVQHAEAEERTIFPILEASCSPEELRSTATRVEKAQAMAPTHPHPHGPNSAVGNMLVGPFAAMVDKVRDKLSTS